jgi:hypothetical protein
LSVNIETNLLSLVCPWLDKFYQITKKNTTKTLHQLLHHLNTTSHSRHVPPAWWPADVMVGLAGLGLGASPTLPATCAQMPAFTPLSPAAALLPPRLNSSGWGHAVRYCNTKWHCHFSLLAPRVGTWNKTGVFRLVLVGTLRACLVAKKIQKSLHKTVTSNFWTHAWSIKCR